MPQIQMGDMVYAVSDLFNDPIEETGEAAIPGRFPNELLARAGARGVVVNIGHPSEEPETEIYLVQFELDANGTLSEPIGCLAEELYQTDKAASAQLN